MSPPEAAEGSARTGKAGEDSALDYLRGQGLALVERNFRCRFGEIDLIMRDRDTLVFVEVRERRSARYGGAAASVTPAKQARLITTAQCYLQRYRHPPACRFDILAIEARQPAWLRNAFALAD